MGLLGRRKSKAEPATLIEPYPGADHATADKSLADLIALDPPAPPPPVEGSAVNRLRHGGGRALRAAPVRTAGTVAAVPAAEPVNVSAGVVDQVDVAGDHEVDEPVAYPVS
jgi:hypothetical protein